MTTASGVDGLTYTLVTISNSITSITDSSLNFYGDSNIDVFSVPLSTTVTSFTNSGIILGGGGNSTNGGNGLTNSGSTTTLTNKGAFLGGGGGGNGTLGGAGGGGGGSYTGANGGSIIRTTTTTTTDGGNGQNYGPFYSGGGGGGPSGNGGTSSNTYTGGIGRGAPGANGSSGGDGSSCISSIFTFGGGGGACSTTDGEITGGGGYGGGDGGHDGVYTGIAHGGGGGGGGNSYGGVGKGGYGIVNTGTITTLNNGQGGTYTVTNGISYGPLFYSGTLPTNYNMIINASGTQSSAQYGQLWCTGWNNSSNVSGILNFGMDYTDSSLNFYTTTQGTSYTYVSALVLSTNITVNGTSGTFNTGVSTGTVKVFNWALSDAYEITLNGTNYRSYDVTLTLSYVYTFNHFTISTYHSNYNNSGNNYYGSNNGSNTPTSYDVFDVSASILSFTNTGIILGGGGLSGATANNGKHGLNNSGSITTLTNKGAFLGGGGGGGNGSYGGAGGGGGGDSSNGGSIVTNIIGSNGPSGGGGGPGGNGGYSNIGGGGGSYGPFGGGGGGYDTSIIYAGPFYGGWGGQTESSPGSGGGGYGGGNGGPTTGSVYGGGGGGGGKKDVPNANAGNGGYSIYNSGTIVTLNNLQGGTIAESPDYFYPFGPLFYTGPLPTNYNIIIDSSSNYGQLWCTGWNSSTVSGNLIFGIDTTNSNSYLFGTTTLSNVLVLPTENASSISINGTSISSATTVIGTSGNFTWTLIRTSTNQKIPYGSTNPSYTTYNLQVTLPYTCFHPDSKILSWKNGKEGNYPISSLRKGDFVKTYKHGYLKIDGIGKTIVLNPGNNERVKSRLYRLTNKEFPELFEDLIITGCHSLLVDSLTEEQKQKILETYGEFKITNDKYRLEAYLEPKAKPWEEECEIEVWHLALECQDYYKNYGIWANGLLVETISKRGLKEYSGMELIE